jgi:hypothetical protein
MTILVDNLFHSHPPISKRIAVAHESARNTWAQPGHVMQIFACTAATAVLLKPRARIPAGGARALRGEALTGLHRLVTRHYRSFALILGQQ